MKRKLFIFIQLVVALSCFGQEDFRNHIQIGVSGGYSLSTIDFTPKINQSYLEGINGGFIINYFAEKNVGIQAEVNFSQRGWEDYNDTSGTYQRQLNYIDIPLLAHISWHIRNFRFQVDLGPYMAFLNSYSEQYDQTLGLLSSVPTDTTILGGRTYYGKPMDSDFDYGFIVGIGPGYSTKFGEFQLKFRYVQGMQSLFNKYPEGNFRFSQSQSIYVGAAWVVPIYFNKKE